MKFYIRFICKYTFISLHASIASDVHVEAVEDFIWPSASEQFKVTFKLHTVAAISCTVVAIEPLYLSCLSRRNRWLLWLLRAPCKSLEAVSVSCIYLLSLSCMDNYYTTFLRSSFLVSLSLQSDRSYLSLSTSFASSSSSASFTASAESEAAIRAFGERRSL